MSFALNLAGALLLAVGFLTATWPKLMTVRKPVKWLLIGLGMIVAACLLLAF